MTYNDDTQETQPKKFGVILHIAFLWPAVFLVISMGGAFAFGWVASMFGSVAEIVPITLALVIFVRNPDRCFNYNVSLTAIGAVTAIVCYWARNVFGYQ